MPTYRVWSGATGANNGTTWADAFTTFGSAVTAANANGDIILVHHTHQDTPTANVTYTFAAQGISVISVNKDSSDAPTAMGTDGWLGSGNASNSVGVEFSGGRRVYFWGVTVRISGSVARIISLSLQSGARHVFENCYFWVSNTAAASRAGVSVNRTKVTCIDCTFRFEQTSQGISTGGYFEIIGGGVSPDGVVPNILFRPGTSTGSNVVRAVGFNAGIVTGTLVENSVSGISLLDYHFDRCRLGSGVVILGSGSDHHGNSVTITDCSSGDVHGLFGYFDQYGSVVSDTGIYRTASPAGQSWRVTTTAIASQATPFATPWMAMFHDGASAITPRLEILRDGSSTAFTDTEVWGVFSVKNNSGFVTPSQFNDRGPLLAAGTAQATGAGTGAWTGASGTAWSGKVDSGSSVAPAEAGDILARVVVAAPSVTVYVDPVPQL